jgi:serine/threonine-protein kinase
LEQDPEATTQVDKGSKVDLVVSSGPQQVAVPDVRGKSQDDATTILEDAGLVVGTTAQQASDKDPGTVIGQDPAPHAMVDKGTPVNLVVSSGPQLVAVPFVVCKSIDDARQILEAQGLDMVEAGSDVNLNCPDPSMVASQDPEAGTEVPKGSTVKVFNAEPPPSPSPSPSPPL